MKHLLPFLGLVAALPLLGQGTINLNNDYVPAGASTKAFVYGCQYTAYEGLPYPKSVGRVEVLDANGNIINGPADGTGKALDADGLFFLGVTDIPNTSPGGNGSIVIRAWDSSTGSTYRTSTLKGQTIVSVGVLGGGSFPAASLETASNFKGIGIQTLDPCSSWYPPESIAEPSVVSLAALGLVGLCFVAGRR